MDERNCWQIRMRLSGGWEKGERQGRRPRVNLSCATKDNSQEGFIIGGSFLRVPPLAARQSVRRSCGEGKGEEKEEKKKKKKRRRKRKKRNSEAKGARQKDCLNLRDAEVTLRWKG